MPDCDESMCRFLVCMMCKDMVMVNYVHKNYYGDQPKPEDSLFVTICKRCDNTNVTIQKVGKLVCGTIVRETVFDDGATFANGSDVVNNNRSLMECIDMVRKIRKSKLAMTNEYYIVNRDQFLESFSNLGKMRIVYKNGSSVFNLNEYAYMTTGFF